MYKLQNQSIKRLSDGALIPLSDGNMDYEEYKQWLSEGNEPLPEYTEEELQLQLKASIVTAVQAHLDREAQSKGYDSIISATSYAGYPNDFQAEGIAFGTWRADVWKYCYQQLAEIESGGRPIIPTVEEFITELPTL